MDDKTMLELAAKAAGIRLEWDGNPAEWQPMYYEGKTYHAWNPLTDDGDALRLAVKLRMRVYIDEGKVSAHYDATTWGFELAGNDLQAATRRAIVRAAAEIGKGVGVGDHVPDA